MPDVSWVPGPGVASGVTVTATLHAPAAGADGRSTVSTPLSTLPSSNVPAVSAADAAPTDAAPTDAAPTVAAVAGWDAAGLEGLLAGVVPGPGLAGLLAGVDLADAGDSVLVEVVAAGARLAAWVASVQAQAAGELAARRAWSAEREHLGEELGLVVGHAGHVGRTLVARGQALGDLPETRDALRAGVVDVAKVDVLAFAGVFAHPQARRAATVRVLPDAPRLGLRALRRRMLAEAVTACPQGVETNRKAAVEQRYVRLEPVENSMAYLTAYLPAEEAVAVWAVVDDAAHQISRTPGEARTLAQARADVLVALSTGNVLPATTSDTDNDTDTATRPTATAPTPTATTPTAPTPTAPTPTAPTPTAPTPTATTPTAPDGTPLSSSAVLAGSAAPGGAGAGGAGAGGSCTSCGAPVGGAGFVLRVVPTRPLVRLTFAASTLLGLDDGPGQLTGYGPVPADLARTLAQDATWQRLLTDPATGILTDYSTTTYTPGPALRRAVQTRDQICTFPGCDQPAEHCDLDHINPYNHQPTSRRPDGSRPAGGSGRADADDTTEPGQTRATNLHALCRRHHRAKTHGGWRVTRDPDTGRTTWTSPTGRTYTIPLTPTDPTHHHQNAQPGPPDRPGQSQQSGDPVQSTEPGEPEQPGEPAASDTHPPDNDPSGPLDHSGPLDPGAPPF